MYIMKGYVFLQGSVNTNKRCISQNMWISVAPVSAKGRVTNYGEGGGAASKWEGGGTRSFTPTKRGGVKSFSHAERGGGGGGWARKVLG